MTTQGFAGEPAAPPAPVVLPAPRPAPAAPAPEPEGRDVDQELVLGNLTARARRARFTPDQAALAQQLCDAQEKTVQRAAAPPPRFGGRRIEAPATFGPH
ncbi:hypothetical protein ABZY09_46425 [Streptomyces sp. NPDC002928]|uniref:hypothetical protein n=1 Tax=Streptomyces sp. NPDC002928 TaxID=3154440 RepID=UPI0033A8BFBA